MNIRTLFEFDGARNATGLVVIIDVYRAATLATFMLNRGISKIIPVTKTEDAFALKKNNEDLLLFGEEYGHVINGFDYSNSPAEIENIKFDGQVAVHRTERGTTGINLATRATSIIFGSFAAAQSIIDFIKLSDNDTVSLVAMDGKGSEDDICADYIRNGIENKRNLSQAEIVEQLRAHPGSERFLDKANTHFPERDFFLCTKLNTSKTFPILVDNFLISTNG